MKVTVGVSARHVHLTKEVFNQLFGEVTLSKKVDLNQIDEFASDFVVAIKGPKGEINNVRILGPFREYTQVEVAKTDAFKLGVNPPVLASGDLEGSAPVTLISDLSEIHLEKGLIIPERHVHLPKEKALELGLSDGEEVSLVVDGIKGGSMKAYAKISDNAYYEVHLDTDDANSFLLNNGDEANIICGK